VQDSPGPIFWLVWCVVVIFELAALWKVFEKAGKPGWAAIIPIYNAIVIIQIARKPTWWFLLYLIPIVNIVIAVIVVHNVAKNFGKGVGFTRDLFSWASFSIRFWRGGTLSISSQRNRLPCQFSISADVEEKWSRLPRAWTFFVAV
jgi:hypothetical protein